MGLSITWAVGAFALAMVSGTFFKPLVFSGTWEFVPWLCLALSGVLLALFVRGVVPKGRRTFFKLFRMHALLGVLVAIAFGVSRLLAMENRHFFPPEREWENLEVLQQGMGATALLWAIGLAACYIIAGRDPKLDRGIGSPSFRHQP